MLNNDTHTQAMISNDSHARLSCTQRRNEWEAEAAACGRGNLQSGGSPSPTRPPSALNHSRSEEPPDTQTNTPGVKAG